MARSILTFLGTAQLVQLVDGARALEGTPAGGLIAKSHINAIADLFFDVASERLALVASYVRGSRGMDPETRGVLELGRMPYQPRFGISALEWESCRNISKALDNCARQVPGSAAFYLALEDVHTISMRVWDPNLGLSEPTINNALSAIADHVQFLPDIASALRTVTGRDLLLPPGVYC